MKEKAIFTITLLVVALALIVSPIAHAEVQHAKGKILVYDILGIDSNGEIKARGFIKTTVLIVNDDEIYFKASPSRVIASYIPPLAEEAILKYDKASNTLTVITPTEKTASSRFSNEEAEMVLEIVLFYSPAIPKSFVENLPTLKSVNIEVEAVTDTGVTPVKASASLSGFSIKRTSYDGYNCIEIAVTRNGQQIKAIIRDDGIMLAIELNGKPAMKLIVEDDVAKTKPSRETTTPTPITTTEATTTQSSASQPPTPQQPVQTSSPTTTSKPTTVPAQASTPITTTTGAQQGLPLTYIAVGVAVAVIAVAVVVLKKLL